MPTAKPGQSPFIPGPSRQILEGLMKENSELKKTVSSLTGKVKYSIYLIQPVDCYGVHSTVSLIHVIVPYAVCIHKSVY